MKHDGGASWFGCVSPQGLDTHIIHGNVNSKVYQDVFEEKLSLTEQDNDPKHIGNFRTVSEKQNPCSGAESSLEAH